MTFKIPPSNTNNKNEIENLFLEIRIYQDEDGQWRSEYRRYYWEEYGLFAKKKRKVYSGSVDWWTIISQNNLYEDESFKDKVIQFIKSHVKEIKFIGIESEEDFDKIPDIKGTAKRHR